MELLETLWYTVNKLLFVSEKLSHSFTVIANISLYVTSLSPCLPVMIMKENNWGVLIIHYGQNTKWSTVVANKVGLH